MFRNILINSPFRQADNHDSSDGEWRCIRHPKMYTALGSRSITLILTVMTHEYPSRLAVACVLANIRLR